MQDLIQKLREGFGFEYKLPPRVPNDALGHIYQLVIMVNWMMPREDELMTYYRDNPMLTGKKSLSPTRQNQHKYEMAKVRER